ncbi:hypothetical protein KTS45_18455 [Halomicroarcula limicola]|uniref:Uncharacterized protein n=1 Tax=Haloarcula limicola TaxID=1429915 RepID=A0A8J7Y8F6_9EURY|nr:hypothetical protein [Halomicroarcula limicola]MBV0926192.1 hypothetical protein [Halomicroarcula limicola]
MGLQRSFDVLSRIVERYESRGRSIRDVEARTDSGDAETLHVSVDAPVSLCAESESGLDSGISLESASLSDGGLTAEFSVSELFDVPSVDGVTISTDEHAVRVVDGILVVTAELTIESTCEGAQGPVSAEASHPDGDEAAELAESEDPTKSRDPSESEDPAESDDLSNRLAAVRNESVPAYEDTEYLTALYEACDTFTEMSEHIPMDVAAETVRRYMIEAGVHDPTSYDTAGDAESVEAEEEEEPSSEPTTQHPNQAAAPLDTIPEEQLVTDGLGLPEDVQVEDVVDAVVESGAVYEVERRLGLDQQRTRELLGQLNVLDLVLCRLDHGDRTASRDDVVRRIRQCTTTEVSGAT